MTDGNRLAPADAETVSFDPVDKLDDAGRDGLALSLGRSKTGELGDDVVKRVQDEKVAAEGAGLAVSATWGPDGSESVSTWEPGSLDREMIETAFEEQQPADSRAIIAGARAEDERLIEREIERDHQRLETFRARAAAIEDADPGYYEIVSRLTDPELPISQAMADFAMDHPTGPAVLYNLVADEQAFAQLAALPPEKQTEVLHRFAASDMVSDLPSEPRQQSKQPRQNNRVTQAPPPIEPVSDGTGGTGQRYRPGMSQGDYNAARRAGRIR